jgi:hypothetical protein
MIPPASCRQTAPSRGWNVSWLTVGLIVSLAAPVSAREPETSGPDHEAPVPPFSREIEQGVLFLNGQPLAPPYRIEATEETLTINGEAYDITNAFGPPRQFGGFGGGHEWSGPDRPSRGNGSRGTAGDPRSRSARTQEQSESEERSASRERGTSRGGSRRSDGPPRSMARWTARHLIHLLESDALVVLFDQVPIRSFHHESERWPIYEALLTESPTQGQIDRFLGAAHWDSARDRWRTWLDEFTPHDRIRAIMRDSLAERDAVATENERQIAATRRLDRLAYPLTIAGMVLSVIAFGHLLQWMGKGLARDDEQAPDAAKHVLLALGLMLGMSLIDLSWTILAGQAGVIKEVNPLAARYLDSPAELALFKVLASLVGFGILFIWRKRYQIQQATWWICLFCVLVTFRWVVFDSMMN